MPGRIVLFGATGYTGRLTAESLVRQGARPVLTGRSAERLESLATELGANLPTATADVSRPESVGALVEPGDVLVSTVGPFARFGEPAVQAAIAAGAHYLDSTGEPAFIRQVFERFGPAAEDAGIGLVTAFGYDFVPGNLAGALALRQAGQAATRVDVGYFFTGRSSSSAVSGGTRASLAGAALAPGFAWRGGRLVTEAGGRRVRSFAVHGKRREAISIGASEHLALPRIAPQLLEVNAYLGWAGPLSRPLQAASIATSAVTRVPGTRAALNALAGRFVKGSSGGPDAAERARSGSYIAAIAYDATGAELAEVRLEGQNGYSFTGDILAWGARTAAAGGLKGTGALGPVDGFGLEELRQGCSEAGIAVV